MSVTKDQILDAIAAMSVMDVVELVTAMEEKFGVSAAAAVASQIWGEWGTLPSHRSRYASSMKPVTPQSVDFQKHVFSKLKSLFSIVKHTKIVDLDFGQNLKIILKLRFQLLKLKWDSGEQMNS